MDGKRKLQRKEQATYKNTSFLLFPPVNGVHVYSNCGIIYCHFSVYKYCCASLSALGSNRIEVILNVLKKNPKLGLLFTQLQQ